MKRFLLFIFILISGFQLKAQNNVAVNIVIPPPFTPFLSDYTTFGGQNLITLTNTTANTYNIKLVGTINGEDNGLFLYTKPNYQPPAPIVLGPFQTYTVTASSPSKDFLTDANTESNVTQQQRNAILASGVLPEGTYKLCVRAVDYFTNEPYSEQDPLGCTFVFINFPLPPILLNPMCNTDVQNPYPSFNWTPVISSGSFILYDLYILKMLPTQIPEDAMWLAIASNVGNPIKISNIQAPVYQYKPYDLPLQPGQKYAWCVVARDVANQIVLSNQGRSEVCTFTYQPTPLTPVISETKPQQGAGVLPSFSLNNTSISGKLLYRYFKNENFSDPGNPPYLPQITVYDEPKNTLELSMMQASAGASNPTNPSTPSSGNVSSFSPITTLGYQNLNQQVVSTILNQYTGKIQIDPSKKYIYENTLNVGDADPLRKTSVSLYLEYVALKRVEDGQSSYFQIVPTDHAVFNRTDIGGKHSGFMDPQLKLLTLTNPATGTPMQQLPRPSGSELLATAITDADGNFTFNFDMTENTGLLQKGPVNLKYFSLNQPEFVESNQFVHPLDIVANPVQNTIMPGNDVLNQITGAVNGVQQQMFGNSQLQTNQGWGNGVLPQVISPNTNPINNLNNNLNKGLKGPADEWIYFPDEVDIIEWHNYSVNHLFKVLRIRINDPYFCQPDILIFAQPGDQLSLPPVATFVNSFDLEMNVKAGGKASDDPLLAPNSPISNFNVRLGRLKSFWQSRPENFPLHEGMDLQPENYFNINNTTPHFVNNPNAAKPGELKFTSFDLTNSQGKVLFKNLVRNKQPISNDAHYFEVQFPQTSIYNYTGSWGSYRLLSNDYTSDFAGVIVVPHSYNFKPTVLQREVKLEPRNPELILRTVTQSLIETSPLQGVQAYMLEYNRNNNSNVFNYFNFRLINTDENGYALFPNLSTSINAAGGVDNPYRRIMLTKNGYIARYLPTNVANAGNNEQNYLAPAKKGQRQNLNEIFMQGGATVSGFVKDEFNNPVTALIKIGDGPFHMTSNTTLSSGYNSPLHANGEVMPSSGNVNNQQLFQMLDNNVLLQGLNPALQNFNFSASGTQSTSVGNVSFNNTAASTGQLYSRFVVNAPSTGSSTRVIVIPMSDQYFADTFYVNIATSTQLQNIGTFTVFEKAHRVLVNVARGGNNIAAIPAANNTLVQVGEQSAMTNTQGKAVFRFTTPDSYFRVFVKDGNRVPIEEYRYLPISKTYTVLNYTTQPGRTISGQVLNAVNQTPVVGARVYAQTGTTPFGETIVQTFTNAQGEFMLEGVPLNQTIIRATKDGSAPTYVGDIKTISPTAPLSVALNFTLQPLDDINIAKIYGFKVELTSVFKNGEEYSCSGAFVNLNESGNFKAYDPNARLRFFGLKVKKSNQNDANGIPLAEALNNEFTTMESSFRTRLFNNFIADIKSDKTTGQSKLVFVKQAQLQGAIRGRVLTDLESFRFSFNYSGQFYISDNTESVSWMPFQSSAGNVPTNYYVTNKGASNLATDIQYSIHNFDARAERSVSTIDKDKVKLGTKLYPQLQLAGQVIVDAGEIQITPQGITINQGDKPIVFNLESWEVRSTQSWNYSIPHGGIIISKAKITTQMVDIPVNNLILRPNQLIMPGEGVELNNLMLGGGVTKLNQYSGTTALLNFDPACSHDLGPHWRFTILRSPASQPACFIQGLPGFAANDKIDIGSFTIFSNNSSLIQPLNQTKKIYNIVDFNIQNIMNVSDALELAGPLYTGIPGVTPPQLIMEYKKPSATIVSRVKAIDLVVETPGKIYFNGDVGSQYYKLEQNYFEANGALAFENDDPNDGKLISLRGKITKTPSQTTLTIPRLKPGDAADAFQYIPMAGGDAKMKVLNGEQRVVGNNWNTLMYTAELITNKTSDGLNDRILDYEVTGAVEVSKGSGNSLEIEKIETPLGDLNMVFDWDNASFLGTLTINIPIQMGAVELNNGLFECMFSGKGFYFDMMGDVTIPGLSSVLSVTVGFLTGYYPELPQSVISRHKDIMYLIDVPEYLKVDGIKGVYINANAAPPAANWSISVPVPLFSVGFGVNAGVDFSFLLNFGNSASVLAISAAAYARAYAGVQVLACTFCVGALAQFMVGGTLTFAPQSSISLDGCASFTVFGEFCGVEASKTIGCIVNATDSGGLDLNVQWSPCGGAASKKDASCDF